MRFFKSVAVPVAALLATALVGIGSAIAADGVTEPVKPASKDSPLKELWSGKKWASETTQEMQEDEFSNPAGPWQAIGEEEWNKVDGGAGKSCASCHQDASESMKGVGARYPVYFKPWKKMMVLEQRINYCRENNMKAKPYKWEGDQMLGMMIHVKAQSSGMPVNVKVDGPAAPFFEKGKEFYYTRRGQLDMACKHCHEGNYGQHIRAETLSQGQSNGFPTYRLKWQKPGSLHRRFRGCNEQVRSEAFERGSDEYVNLELYLAWRGKGLPVETPSVRR